MISAFHLFKRTHKEQQFIENLKAISKEKDPSSILKEIVKEKKFEAEEIGTLKYLQDSEPLKELLDSVKN